MDAVNWIFVILTRFAPVPVATDVVAKLSITILCLVLAFSFLRPAVANRRRRKVQQWNLQAREVICYTVPRLYLGDILWVNDSLYELHKPEGDPTMQVLFFHGLPFEESSEAHLSTWISGDESCIWPKVWLAEEFPDAHILVVSYIKGLSKGSAENFDMHIISENLMSDLMQANIGQTPHCPVVLVGHSFGGLVIKELCRHAHETFKSSMNAAKLKKLLDSLRGVFYYSTPHHGSSDIGKARSVLSRPLFDYFTALSRPTSRLNFVFQNLCKCYPKWKIDGLGEMLSVTTGIFQGTVVVPEASARDGVNFNVDCSADHFAVCRPEKKTSRRFNALTTLLTSVCDSSKEEKAMAGKQAIRQDREFLPNHLVNMDVLVHEVKGRLEKFNTVGLVGMGGLGKTTLARAVFNELSPAFEYSCFVPDLKVKEGDVEEVKKAVWKHMHRLGRKVEDREDWSALNAESLLLVLDDMKDDRDIMLLSHLVYGPSSQSRFIVTSRDRDLLNRVADIDIYQTPFLDQKNAEKLFLSHAFPKPANLPANLERDMVAIVEKCSGLPLALGVLGSHLKFKRDGKFWQQTLKAVIKADNIGDLDKRLWAKLRVSYDGLQEVEKQMFLDATTFFQGSYWTLRDAKAAWRKAYETEYETIQWQTLVDRSLIYHVEENESIKVHDQLGSLGRKIASEPSNSCRCRVWDETMALQLLQTNELANQDIHGLRLYHYPRHDKIYISSHAVHNLKKLQYLEVDSYVVFDGVEEEFSIPSKLVLLRWNGYNTPNFDHQHRLVVLRLSGASNLPRSVGQLSGLRIFMGSHLTSVPDEFGNLSQLEHLELSHCRIKGLPEKFYKLSKLEYLTFRDCHDLTLPEKFGALPRLKVLKFDQCNGLRSLPKSFGYLSALEHLVITCWSSLFSLPPSYELPALPDTFGNLRALEHLELHNCYNLQGLPDSFGDLSALKHLELHCYDLHGLPDSFGDLSALKLLELHCYHLQALPDSFGNLSALMLMELRCCHLQGLPDSFGKLEALEHFLLNEQPFQTVPSSFGKLSTLRELSLIDCGPNILSVIPFSGLTQLQKLVIRGEGDLIQMKELPESLAELTALTHLVLWKLCIRSIPDFTKSAPSLHTVELCVLPYVKEVPTWLGDDGVAPLALSRKIFQVKDKRLSLTREVLEMTSSQELLLRIKTFAMEKMWENDYQGAFEDFTIALDLSCDDAECDDYASLYDCWRYRGYVNFLLGDLGRATHDAGNAFKLLRRYPHDALCPGVGRETVTYMEFRLAGQFELSWQDCNVRYDIAPKVMEKVGSSDFQGALAIWCDFDARVLGFYDRVHFWQESGMLKRMVGDLQGALEDLTAALEIDHDNYEVLKHRGYVKYLMRDESGARKDAERCMTMEPRGSRRSRLFEWGFEYDRLGSLPVAFLEFRLKGTEELRDGLWSSVQQQVMKKVKEREFLGGVAIWDDFDARVCGHADRCFFLQERGILKRMAGDLHGALEDLTAAALEVNDEKYEVLKHRGYVKFLLGDIDGARKDAEKCLALGLKEAKYNNLGGFAVAFLEFKL